MKSCDQDFKVICGDNKNLGECFSNNFSCFSTECKSAVKEAVKVEGDFAHGPHGPGGPHDGPGGPHGPHDGPEGEHHGHGGKIPQEVKDACRADKEKLCGDKHGMEALQCMKDNVANLSKGCTDAINKWKSTMPTPPAIFTACKSDKETLCPGLEGLEAAKCMFDNASKVSAGCKNAWSQITYSTPSTSTTTTNPSTSTTTSLPTSTSTTASTSTSDSTSTTTATSSSSTVSPSVLPSSGTGTDSNVVAALEAVGTEPVTQTAPSQTSPTSKKCNSGGMTVESSKDSASVVEMAYTGVGGSQDAAPPSHKVRNIVIGVVVGVCLIAVVTFFAVRKYRAMRTSSQNTPPQIQAGVPIVESSNPLAYNHLTNESIPAV